MAQILFNTFIMLFCRAVLFLLPSKIINANTYTCVGDIVAYFKMEKLAIEFYNKAKERSVDAFSINKKIANLLLKIKQYDKAVKIYINLENQKIDPEVLYKCGKALERQGKNIEAIAKYQEAIEQDPYFVAAYCGWASVLDDIGELEIAIEKYKIALSMSPDNPHIMISLALAYEASGELNKAYKYIIKSIAISPDIPEAYFACGTIYEKLGNLDSAIIKYKEALRLDPFYDDVYVRWGEALYLQGKYDEAAQKFAEALKIVPENSWALYDLACTYVKMDQIKKAVKYIKRAIKLDNSILEDIKSNSNLSCIINQEEIKVLVT